RAAPSAALCPYSSLFRSYEQRGRQHQLSALPVGTLDVASHQQVEQLIGPTQFDVGPHRDRVVCLRQGIEELVDADGDTAVEALGEVVALQHPGDCVVRSQLDELCEPQWLEPFGVVTQLELGGIGIEDGSR